MIANLISNFPLLLCLLLGAGLMIVEVFVPGFGLPGFSGIVLIGIGVMLTSMHFGASAAVAVLLGWLIYAELLTAGQWCGFVLVIAASAAQTLLPSSDKQS